MIRHLVFILFFSMLMVQCGDDCNLDDLENNIIGTWEVTNGIGTPIQEDLVSFNVDATGEGVEDGTFYFVGIDTQSSTFNWSLNADTLSVIYQDQFEKSYTAQLISCTEIRLESEINIITLFRK